MALFLLFVYCAVTVVLAKPTVDPTDNQFFVYNIGFGSNNAFASTHPKLSPIVMDYRHEDTIQTALPPSDTQWDGSSAFTLNGENVFYYFQLQSFKRFLATAKPFEPKVEYSYILMKNGQIRIFETQAYDWKKLEQDNAGFESEDPAGHTSMLTKKEYESVGSSQPTTGSPVLYAGTILTDENGKLKKITNDSGHFKPSASKKKAILRAFGLADGQWEGYTEVAGHFNMYPVAAAKAMRQSFYAEYDIDEGVLL